MPGPASRRASTRRLTTLDRPGDRHQHRVSPSTTIPSHYRKEFARYFQVTPADLQRVAETVPDRRRRSRSGPAGRSRARPRPRPRRSAPSPSPRPTAATPGDAPAGPGPRLDEAARPGRARPVPAPAVRRGRRSPTASTSGSPPGRRLPLVRCSLLSPGRHRRRPRGQVGPRQPDRDAARPGDDRRRPPPSWPRPSRSSARASAWPRALDDTGRRRSRPRPEPRARRSTLVGRDAELAPVRPQGLRPRADSSSSPTCSRGPTTSRWIARRAFPLLMFGPDHPYGKPAAGLSRDGQGADPRRRPGLPRGRSAPRRATLIVTGDVDPDAVTQVLEQTLGRWRDDELRAPAPTGLEPKAEPGVGLPGRQAGGRAERDQRRPPLGRPARSPLLRHPGRQPPARRRLPQPAEPEPPREARLHLRRRLGLHVPPQQAASGACRPRSGPTRRPRRLKEILKELDALPGDEADHGRGDRHGPLGRGPELPRDRSSPPRASPASSPRSPSSTCRPTTSRPSCPTSRRSRRPRSRSP